MEDSRRFKKMLIEFKAKYESDAPSNWTGDVDEAK